MSSNEISGLPAAAPPPGVAPDLTDPSTLPNPSFAVSGVFVSLMLIAVLIRAFVCVRLTKSWGWNDCKTLVIRAKASLTEHILQDTCFIAAIGSVAHTVVFIVVLQLHPLRYLYNESLSSLSSSYASQFISVNGITYLLSIFFTKISILLLYQLLFGVNRIFWLCVRITIVIFCLFYIPTAAASIAFSARCNLLENLLAYDTPLRKFCDVFSYYLLFVNASFNVATDFWLLLLPMPIIAKLQVSLKQKLGIGAIFAGGLGACAASLARLIVIVVTRGSREVTLALNTVAELSVAEVNIGIIVACAPCFPLFYNHARGWFITLRQSRKDKLYLDEPIDIVSFH
ncbi:hypothetical protein HD806DRAFT_541650 [Xylariaceae sp. AK1471]|nr:hypothetical protein HD806DRAFT_541650 [Xylariaceae sp. AK1471]